MKLETHSKQVNQRNRETQIEEVLLIQSANHYNVVNLFSKETLSRQVCHEKVVTQNVRASPARRVIQHEETSHSLEENQTERTNHSRQVTQKSTVNHSRLVTQHMKVNHIELVTPLIKMNQVD